MAKRKLNIQVYKKNRRIKFLGLILKLSGFCLILCVFGSLFLFIHYSKDLPRPEKFTEKQLIRPTRIYDRTGEILLYEIYGEEKRIVVPIEKIPEHMKQAVITAEDANFYNHFGLDIRGIFRAVMFNIRQKGAIQGASTITQQLIRSCFLTPEKTAERKIREIILTLELERKYTKDQILEWYLNQVPFGSNCYGVESASQTYFKKSVSDISLNESALLASLIKAPTYFSPYGKHKDELFARKNYILSRMELLDYISETELDELKNSEIEFARQITSIIKAPHFALYVKKQLEQEYGTEFLRQKGLKVYTTLNWDLQEQAEIIISEKSKINENHNAFNASLVAINPKTGEILTMVGSKDYFGELYPKDCVPRKNCSFEPDFNIATLSSRQPGSAFKPFAYAKAFEKGFTPDTVLWDALTNFGVWGAEPYVPENYDEKFRGPISLRSALAQSINVPSVKVLYLAGIRDTINFAKSLGITTLNEKPSFYGLSLVLGGGEVKLLDITSAYGVFASRGLKIPPQTILKIEDLDGNIIKENKKTAQRILETNVADLINNILSDNEARTPMFGPRSALYIDGYDVAAKTGTTQEYKDAWVIGYTPTIAVGVWVGNNDNSVMKKEPGVVIAGPIWNLFMIKAITYFPKENFHKPKPNVSEKDILLGIVDMEEPHSILYYVNKNDPQGDKLQNPKEDSQYTGWEAGIKLWLDTH